MEEGMNLFCPGQKAASETYRSNFDQIKWSTPKKDYGTEKMEKLIEKIDDMDSDEFCGLIARAEKDLDEMEK